MQALGYAQPHCCPQEASAGSAAQEGKGLFGLVSADGGVQIQTLWPFSIVLCPFNTLTWMWEAGLAYFSEHSKCNTHSQHGEVGPMNPLEMV